MGGASPLRARGLLRKVGRKQYQRTDIGRRAADELVAGGARVDRRLTELSRGLVLTLRRMLSSPAFSKFTRGERLSFSDVCGFWNISPRTTAYQFADRTRAAEGAIE